MSNAHFHYRVGFVTIVVYSSFLKDYKAFTFNLQVHVAELTCVSWGAHTLVLINAILALSVLTGVAGTVIFIELTVHP